ncbi:MAG: acetoacetate decarboxylase family protein [Polyangiaceae bacterium]
MFFIPVAFGTTKNGSFHAERVVWFAPVVYVDTSAAVAEGREVYGFPKLLGRVVAPRLPDDPAHFSLTGAAYQGTPIARQLRPATIFEAQRQDAAKFGAHDKSWGTLIEAITGMIDLLKLDSGDGLWESLRERAELFTLDQRLLVLKQFRDAVDGTRACLLQAVECPITVTDFQGAGLVSGDWLVTIPRYPGLDIAEQLGIRGGTDPIKPLAIYRVKLDCRMENGIIVWSAPT